MQFNRKDDEMKKWIIMLVLAVGVTSWAQENVVLTGKVVKTRSGVNNAVFYTLEENETGKQYEANTLAPDVAKHEGLFKEALKSKKEMYIEFDTNPQFPNAIRRIKKIELKESADHIVG
jgi:hypothetical protein